MHLLHGSPGCIRSQTSKGAFTLCPRTQAQAVSIITSDLRVKTVKGTRKYHAFYFSAGVAFENVRVCELSCFCGKCAEGKWGECENRARLPPYEWRKLEMTQVTQRMTRALVTDMASAIALLVDPAHPTNQYFAVLGDREEFPDHDYFLLKATKRVYTITQAGGRKDSTGNVFPAGSIVVEGQYFERSPNPKKWNHRQMR